MTAKPKPITTTRDNDWKNKLALPKYFSLETDLSPIEVMERLNAMQQGTEGLFFPFRWAVDFQQSSEGTLFCIQRKRLLLRDNRDYQRRTFFTSIQADGLIQLRHTEMGTLLQGYLKFGWGNYVVTALVFACVLLVLCIPSSLTYFLFAITGINCLVLWFLMCYDRTYFTRELEAALQRRKMKEQ